MGSGEHPPSLLRPTTLCIPLDALNANEHQLEDDLLQEDQEKGVVCSKVLFYKIKCTIHVSFQHNKVKTSILLQNDSQLCQ